MPDSRKHHFVSQFYLAGFTNDETEEGTLYCFDLQTKRVWPTKTKEVAHRRDFNRIEAPNLHPSFIELELSKMESNVAPVFRTLKSNRQLPTGDGYALLMNFIALLGVRNPELRTSFDLFRTEAYRKMMAMYLQDENRWESLKQNAIKDGKDSFRDVSYSDVKRMILEKEWKVRGTPDSFHSMEFNAMRKVVQLLANRDWSLVLAPKHKYFVTGDHPVALGWTIPDDSAPHGPGFGSLHSAVHFTLNRSMAMIGRFNDTTRVVDGSSELVGAFNSIIVTHANRFVYGSESSFVMLDDDEQESDSQRLLGITLSN